MRLLPAVLLSLVVSWSTFGQTYTIVTTSDGERPWGVAVDSSGNLYFAEWGGDRIRKVAAGG